MKYIQFTNFNEKNQNNRYYITLGEDTYILNLKWSKYCDCAFLSINDYNNNPIISGRALTNGTFIRNNLLPYTFAFLQLNGETYEPTIDNISTEFALVYKDEEDDD